MPFSNRNVHHPLVQLLRGCGPLSVGADAAIRALPVKLDRARAKADIVSSEQPAESTFFIIEGMAASYKCNHFGGRQIVGLHVRGDMPDLLTLHLPKVDTAISAVGECYIGRVRHADVRALCHANLEVSDSLWRQTLIEASLLREWVRNVGSRDGLERIAHLFCEIVTRKEAVGAGSRTNCPLELNQQDLADATGMTVVHANRTVQELRSRSLISLKKRVLNILDWAKLSNLAGFDPAYLCRYAAPTLS